MNILLKKGDVFLTRGDGFISRAIRFFTREIGEKRTKVNHVGLVVQSGNLESAIVVEALTMVKRHKLWSQYGPPKKDLVAVYRAINLTQEEVDKIVTEAERQVGKKCVFRSIPATYSGAFRPPIPEHSGHPFRSIPATLKSYNL